jgi:hypothetical protein
MADIGISYNWSLGYTTDAAGRAAIERSIATSHGGLLFDTFGNEMESVKAWARRYPSKTIEYRLWLGEGHEIAANGHHITPQRWAEIHAPMANVPNIYCTAGNESDPRQTRDWYMGVIREAVPRGIRVAVGGWAYGNPDARDYPDLLPLFRLMEQHWEMCVLDLHEYASLHTMEHVIGADWRDERTWPASVPLGQRWHMGRFAELFAFLRANGVRPPRVIIGETTYAAYFDADKNGVAPLPRTFAQWGIQDWQTQAAKEMLWAWNALYAPFPEILMLCAFTRSTSPVWEFSNWRHAPQMMGLLEKGFDRMTTPTTPEVAPQTVWPAGTYTLNTHLSSVNVRSATGVLAGSINRGATVTVTTNATTKIVIGGVRYTCQQIDYAGSTAYLAITNAFTLVPVAAPPDDSEFVAALRAAIARVRAELLYIEGLVDEYESL